MNTMNRCLALVRIRGEVGVKKELEYVFKIMHLTRKNYATLIENTPSNLGLVNKVKDYSTWGEVTPKTVSLLLRNRGFSKGNGKLTDDYVKNKLGYASIEELANDIYDLKIIFQKIPNIKPLFRLHPPRKGFRGSIRRPYPEGALGYRGEAIHKLIVRMI